MYLTSDDRKKLQALLENAIPNIPHDEGKNFFLLFLALLKDVEEMSITPGAPQKETCSEKNILTVMDDLAKLELPETIDAQYLHHFSFLVEKLERLSLKMSELQKLLVRLHGEGKPFKKTGVVVQ